MIALLVALGAAVGAPARYLTDRAIQSRHQTAFPYGTFAVNLTASLLLGVLVGAAGHLSGQVQALVATGFCGALSTFSTFSFEVLRLVENRRAGLAAVYALGSVLVAIGFGALGWWLGAAT